MARQDRSSAISFWVSLDHLNASKSANADFDLNFSVFLNTKNQRLHALHPLWISGPSWDRPTPLKKQTFGINSGMFRHWDVILLGLVF